MQRAQTWQTQLETTGRVTFGSSIDRLLWLIGLASVAVAFFLVTQYQMGHIGRSGFAMALAGFALLDTAMIVFLRWQFGGDEIVVDTHGITPADGKTFPWSDIASVDVYAPAKAPRALSVNLTQSAWDAHLDRINSVNWDTHPAEKVIERERAILLPGHINANLPELAAWLNGLAQGNPDS